MNTDYQSTDPKDRMLWEIAGKRASFKGHLLSYILVNGFLWAIWYFSGQHYSGRYSLASLADAGLGDRFAISLHRSLCLSKGRCGSKGV